MGTLSGDVIVDFTVLADTNPYVPSGYAKLAADTGGAIKVASAKVLATSAFGSAVRYLYQGSMDASKDIVASVKIDVAHVSDIIYAIIADKTSGAGYLFQLNDGNSTISSVTSGGSLSGLISSGVTAVSGDVFDFTWNHTTHNLSVTQNGTGILSTTDATYTSALTFGFGLNPGNNNTSTVLGTAGTGIAPAGPSVAARTANLFRRRRVAA